MKNSTLNFQALGMKIKNYEFSTKKKGTYFLDFSIFSIFYTPTYIFFILYSIFFYPLICNKYIF
jgi:hypothetical protein